jgi:hypothetical protein
MRSNLLRTAILTLSSLVVPLVVSAQTVSALLGFVNISAGIILVAALLPFFGGFIFYLVVLGNERRKNGLVLMVWGVLILFVLVVLLGIVKILQRIFL